MTPPDDWAVVRAGIRIHPDEPTDVMVSLEQNAFDALARLREREAQLTEQLELYVGYMNEYEPRTIKAEARVRKLEAALREIAGLEMWQREEGWYVEIARRALAHEEEA